MEKSKSKDCFDDKLYNKIHIMPNYLENEIIIYMKNHI